MTQSQEKLIKIVLLGSIGVGKTSILQKYLDQEFKENYHYTTDIYFRTKFFKFDDTKIKVNYIYTEGQEKFRAISLNYLKGVDGAILVFDITERNTFELMDSWLDNMRQNNRMNIGKVLIGNKSDLESERIVSKKEGEQLAKLLECKYYETSAKTGQNINQAMDEMAKITYSIWKNSENKNSITISSIDSEKPSLVVKKKGC